MMPRNFAVFVASVGLLAAISDGKKTSKSSKTSTSKASKRAKSSKTKVSKKHHATTPYPTRVPTSHPTNRPSSPPKSHIPTTVNVSPIPTTKAPTTFSTCPLPAPFRSDPIPCIPTAGPCISDESTLKSVAESQISDGDVVALCDGVIETSDSIQITTAGTTLCCESNSECTLKASSSSTPHQLLRVTGKDFKVSGIKFQGGNGQGGGLRGGNLAVEASGHHLLENCIFHEGKANYGGNAFVQTTDSLTIRGSTFSSGLAGEWGGGLAVFDASSLIIEDSTFIANDAMVGGGLMTHWEHPRYLEPDGQNISIYNSSFEGNGRGAFLATNIGELPSLRVWESSFVDNDIGIEICCKDEDVYDAVLCDNEGSGTDDPCESIRVWGESGPAWCLQFDQDYPSW